MIAAMPPPITKPATAAPARTFGRLRLIWRAPVGDRDDLAAQLGQRRRRARTGWRRSMRGSGPGCGAGCSRALILRLDDDLADLLLHERGLILDGRLRLTRGGDRLIGHRRLRLLQRLVGREARRARRGSAGARRSRKKPQKNWSAGKMQVPGEPRDAVQDQDERAEDERARRRRRRPRRGRRPSPSPASRPWRGRSGP